MFARVVGYLFVELFNLRAILSNRETTRTGILG